MATLTLRMGTPENRAAAVSLARGADILFIEAPFAAADADIAADRRHLNALGNTIVAHGLHRHLTGAAGLY